MKDDIFKKKFRIFLKITLNQLYKIILLKMVFFILIILKFNLILNWDEKKKFCNK